MTLVEMLVVIVIVGIAAGAVALGMGAADRGNRVEGEARRLAAHLRLAADDVMVTDRAMVFVHDRGGYAFAAGEAVGAGDRVDGEAFARHDLPAGMVLDAGRDAAVPVGIDGAGPPITATIAGRGKAWRVVFDGLNVVAAPVGGS